MKTIIVHDGEGNILSFLIPAQDVADQVGAEPGPGQGVAYVDTSDFGSDVPSMSEPSSERAFEEFGRRIFEDFRIHNGAVARKTRAGHRDSGE